jgi:Immunity protein 26
MVKKLKLKEGNVFAIPLVQGGYCIGLVAREYKTIRLGYFFNKVYSTSTLLDVTTEEEVNKNDIVLIRKFSTNGFKNSEWVLLERGFIFYKEQWPIPVFKMQDPLTEKYYAVFYDETLVSEKRSLISEAEAHRLYNHGLSGYKALEKQVSILLSRS